jgi:ketosteroid isomerase-like protein
VSEQDEFLSWVGSVVKDAEIALHNGDAAPRLAIWSEHDPVTVLGAWKSATGRQEVRELFAQLETSFSDCMSFVHEVVEADVIGDLAYTVGYEHGEWRVVHRHADTVPDA